MGAVKTRITTLGKELVQAFSTPPPVDAYSFWVRDATRKLYDSFFGTWPGHDDDGTPNPAKDKMDRQFWENEYDPRYKVLLVLKAGQDPALAIPAVLDRLILWQIDCDLTVQVSNLYALLMTYGAQKFRDKVAIPPPSGNNLLGTRMQLRFRESSGLVTAEHYARLRPGDAWAVVDHFNPGQPPLTGAGWTGPGKPVLVDDFVYDGVPPSPSAPAQPTIAESTAQLVARAPVGSRVRFTDLKAPIDDGFRHENCVKIGPDLYAAGGLPPNPAPDRPSSWPGAFSLRFNEYSERALMVEIALSNPNFPSNPSWADIEPYVFVDEVEIFERY